MAPVFMFKLISGALALLALACGGMAAWRSYQATMVPTFPAWVPPGWPGLSEPVDPAIRQADIDLAAYEGAQKIGLLNRVAIRWTIAAVLFGAGASLASLFPLSGQ